MVALVLAVSGVSACKRVPSKVHLGEEHRRELTRFDEAEKFRGNPRFLRDKQPLMWRRMPSTKFRLLNYAAAGGVEVAVGQAGGSLLANVNRWRGELGLGSLTDLQLTKVDVWQGQGEFFEASGDFKGRGASITMAVLVPREEGGWLSIKMTGPSEAVQRQREAFLAYARTVRVDAIPLQLEKEADQAQKGVQTNGE